MPRKTDSKEPSELATLNVQLRPELRKRLDDVVRRSGRSLRREIERALDIYLPQEEAKLDAEEAGRR